MRDRVKARNFDMNGNRYKCDICRIESTNAKDFINAHLIADAFAKQLREKSRESGGKFADSPGNTTNGLLLCRTCDVMFEGHDLEVSGKGGITISKEAMKNPSFKDAINRIKKYKYVVPWKDHIDTDVFQFPTSAMLEWRKTLTTALSKRALEEMGEYQDEVSDDEKVEELSFRGAPKAEKENGEMKTKKKARTDNKRKR